MFLGTPRYWWIITLAIFVVALAFIGTDLGRDFGTVLGILMLFLAMILFAASPMRRRSQSIRNGCRASSRRASAGSRSASPCASSRAGSQTRRISSRLPAAATCSAASRRESCCPRHMPWTASFAS